MLCFKLGVPTFIFIKEVSASKKFGNLWYSITVFVCIEFCLRKLCIELHLLQSK